LEKIDFSGSALFIFYSDEQDFSQRSRKAENPNFIAGERKVVFPVDAIPQVSFYILCELFRFLVCPRVQEKSKIYIESNLWVFHSLMPLPIHSLFHAFYETFKVNVTLNKIEICVSYVITENRQSISYFITFNLIDKLY